MACQTSSCTPGRATPVCDAMEAAQCPRPPVAATSRVKIPAPKRSETRSAPERGARAAGNRAKPRSTELLAKRAARIAEEQEMAALCQRRASQWAAAIREGLDPDIACFVRSQAAAWRLLASSYARSARDALAGPEDAR
jgi:hypothetical protein